MDVKGSDGKHIGTVDRVEDNRVWLASGGMYHYIDIAVVDAIKVGAVCLSKSAEETTRLGIRPTKPPVGRAVNGAASCRSTIRASEIPAPGALIFMLCSQLQRNMPS